MLLDSNRTHSRTSTSMRDAECLVQIQMTHISSNFTRASVTDLSIHIGSVHVDLASFSMHHFTHLHDILFKHTVSRWIGDHES